MVVVKMLHVDRNVLLLELKLKILLVLSARRVDDKCQSDVSKHGNVLLFGDRDISEV
jgi:hypothetical protein